MANAVEFVPDQAKTEAVEAHVIWMTTGLELRWRLGRHDLGRRPEPRGHRHPGDPRDAEGDRPQPGARLRERRRVHAGLVRRRGRQARPVRARSSRARSRTRSSRGEGYWAAMGTDHDTGQPITTNEWVDRLAPKAAAVVALGTCATYGGIPAMKNNPTGAMGVADYLGWDWKSSAGLPGGEHPGLSRPSPTTRRSPCSTWPCISPGALRSPTWTRRTGRPGCSAARSASPATGAASPSRASSPPSTAPITAAW